MGLTLVNVLLVYSHYWGWVLVGTEGLYLLLCRREKVLPFAVSVLVTVGLLRAVGGRRGDGGACITARR